MKKATLITILILSFISCSRDNDVMGLYQKKVSPHLFGRVNHFIYKSDSILSDNLEVITKYDVTVRINLSKNRFINIGQSPYLNWDKSGITNLSQA